MEVHTYQETRTSVQRVVLEWVVVKLQIGRNIVLPGIQLHMQHVLRIARVRPATKTEETTVKKDVHFGKVREILKLMLAAKVKHLTLSM